ncbi:MAG: hypothetical protein ACYTGZ_01230 [Planctomycetota bacterium]
MSHRKGLIPFLAILLAVPLMGACGEEVKKVPVPGHPGALKSAASVRAQRRAYEGAPPVIPHKPFGAACINCHSPTGLHVPGTGYAPPNPHGKTAGLAGTKTCTQCHVWKNTDGVWRKNSFDGLRQDLRRGEKAFLTSPPVIPHAVQMRENCMACHTGPAAREEIRCSHPERTQCRQCHVPRITGTRFERKS